MLRTSKILFFALIILLAAFILLPARSSLAAPLFDVPVMVTQPDGQVLQLFASGDEYYNWLHDRAGYTVLRDPATGWYVYADMLDGELVPTKLVAGRSDPASGDLLPGLNLSTEAIGALRQAHLDLKVQEAPGVSPAPSTGTLTNLVVFIRFSGEAGFTNTLPTYTGMFTDSTSGANSLRNYFLDVSYSNLTVTSNFYPTPAGSTILSYQDGHPRTYFEPYNAATNPGGYQDDSQRTEREQTLLRDAIEYIKALGQFPAGAVIDGDNDGEVDSMTFVIKGSGNGWAELLWPHQWSLYYYTVTINGKTVGNYAFQLDDWMGNSVLAHEMFHVLGSPDLYHYNFDGMRPVGTWDVMESNTNPPQHMGCYMKYKYGHWIDSIPQITQPGTYTLNPLATETNNCYKIASPNSATEFFILEYRSKPSSYFETGIPGSGMLVYRINPAVQGNADGPPDEVYIFRPGGTPLQDGTYPTANFSSTVGRTQINSGTDPKTFLSNGSYGGLSLCNIGPSEATISFNYGNCGALQVSPAAYDFGSVNLGSTSSAQAFTLANNGTGSVTVGTLSVSSSYNLSSNTCNGVSLAPAASCTFSVSFSPLSAGLLTGIVTIPSNDPNSPNLVGLSGTGSGVFASVNPTAWNFGDQAVSSSSSEKTFTLTSSGNENLVLGTLTVSGDFSLVNNTCNGQTLVPAAACSFGVIFTPSVAGARIGSVSIPSNAFGAPTSVPLSGNGTTPGYCASSSIYHEEFLSRVQLGSGDQSSGGDAYHDYTAMNFTSLARGTSNPMQVTGTTLDNYPEFVKAWVDFNHDFDFGDPGEELNLGFYTFSGTHVFSGNLAVPANAPLGATRMRVIMRYNSAPSACGTYNFGETEDYTVTIAESLEPEVQVNPAAWNFGDQPVATSSAAKSFTLTNIGAGNLVTGTLTASGDFALVGNTCNGQNIPPAGTCTLGVTFTPTTEGTRNGSVSIPSNAQGSPHTVALSGYGTHPPSAFNKSSPVDTAVGQSTSGTLSWEPSIYAQFYEICIDTTNDTDCSTSWVYLGTSTSIEYSGLNNAATYYWQVRASNPYAVTYANGSSWWSFTTLVAAPGAFNKSLPANGAYGQPTSLTLTWGASSGATSYEYCYDTTDDSSCTGWTGNGTATSKILSGLSEGTTYYWHVRAINAGGTTYANGSNTAFWTFTTLVTPPGTFNKSTPVNGATGQPTSLTLTWGASPGAMSYEYCYDTTDNSSCTGWTSNGSATSKSLNSLSEGTTYYWQVRATNAGGATYANGSNTAFWSFTTLVTPPGAFNKSLPANGAVGQPTSLSLTWGASSGATSYEYCYDTTDDSSCSGWTGNGTATSKSLTGLSEGTTYYWHVRAVNAGGTTYANGSTTAFWSFTTLVSPPGAFNKSMPANSAVGQPTSLTLSWAASPGAASYEYCYDSTNNAACDSSWVANGNSTSASSSSLAPGTIYHWQVRANNAGGTTFADGGTWWSFTTPSSFSDVVDSHWALTWIERLYNSGITTGCNFNPLIYCPEEAVTRTQMAVFLIRATHGVSFVPPPPTGIFNDVPTNAWAANYIEQLYADGITTGCNPPLMLYCPADSVTRAQMAAFLLRAKHGAAYNPPDPLGIFSDVPTTHWAAKWIEQLYAEGITTGCSTSPLLYCPEQSVTRAQMAAFLVRTFGLP